MKHFLKSVLFFIPFLIIAYTILIFVWGRFAPNIIKQNINYRIGSHGHMYSRLKEINTSSDIDILFLGSSHAYRGFDTRIFREQGLKGFNLGSSAQTPIQTRALLNKYLDLLNPRIIIYEVYPVTFSIDGVESSIDIIANDKNDFHSIKMALDLNHIIVYNTIIYGIIRDALNLNTSFIEQKKKDNDTYISGGYVEKDFSYYKYVDYQKKEWDLNKDQFIAFDEVLSIIKERNIHLILVNAPITSSLYNSYTNNNTFDNIMNGYGDYYNFNTILSLNDSLHFYDTDHLNQNGVQIFNDKLIEIINEK